MNDYPGFATRPFTWDEIVAKLDDLAADRADEGLRKEIAAAVRSVESTRVKDLMNLLARGTTTVRPEHGRSFRKIRAGEIMKRPLTVRIVAALAFATAGFALLAYGDFASHRTLRAADFAAIALAVIMLVLFDARSTR